MTKSFWAFVVCIGIVIGCILAQQLIDMNVKMLCSDIVIGMGSMFCAMLFAQDPWFKEEEN